VAAAAALAVAVGTGAACAQETPGERLPVRELTLDNGMRVLVLPRSGAPTVSFVVQVGVGSVQEHLGITGIAHMLEHMLFKGTTSIGTTDAAAEAALFERMDAAHDTLLSARASADSTRARLMEDRIDSLGDSARAYVVPNELDRIFTEAGARGLNATTSYESTVYYVELPANRARLWFVLEADLMENPVFREFYSERKVVAEERRMRVDTNPAGVLSELFMHTAFMVHPYGVPVVGYMSDLQNLSRRDVASYYKRFYGPNNAVVAIVGDVDPDQMADWARQYFGPIPRGDDPPPVLAVEPPQRGERRVRLEWDAEPRLMIGWHVPSSLDPDAPALEILASVLTGSRNSRLYRRLITDDGIATGVSASLGPGDRFPELFEIDAVPLSPHTTDELEAAIYDEIARVARDGPTASELERVHDQVDAGNVRRIESNLGLAFQIAASESLHGDWRETFRSTAQLDSVSAEDVRRVAAKYLVQSNRTVAVLDRKARK
jgi:predicted Zn-dependent peptidase